MIKEELGRQRELESRLKAQQERILRQRKQEFQRSLLPKIRNEGISLTSKEKKWDKREEKIKAQDSSWDGIWMNRKAKWDARRRKYAGE